MFKIFRVCVGGHADPSSRARASPSDERYAVNSPPPLSKILDPPLGGGGTGGISAYAIKGLGGTGPTFEDVIPRPLHAYKPGADPGGGGPSGA